MAAQIPTLMLSDGYSIPQLGLGTWTLTGAEGQHAIETAIELGYRHIDTAQIYDNEKIVGAAIAASGLPRSDFFITTKLHNKNHEAEDARPSFDESLKKLGVDYVDLFLIHWPLPKLYGGRFPETWRLMQEFVADGRTRSAGVSNFQIAHLERLVNEVGVAPAVNQIEAHPLFPNNEVREWMHAHGGIVQAWRPIVKGALLGDADVIATAERLGRTPAQVVLRWHIERGHVVFPKSSHAERLQENMQLFDFELDEAARALLDGMDRGPEGRVGFHPDEYNPEDL